MRKLALVADVKDWAFDIAANIIKNALSDKYQIDIYYTKSEEFQKDLFKILETLKDYDLIHFFWRAILLDFQKEDFKARVIEKYGDYDLYVRRMVNKISTGVYDHLYENDIQFNSIFTQYCKSYVVSSRKLFEHYSNLEGIKKPSMILGDSFEKERFHPTKMERFNFNNDKSDKLIVGWVGNSTWNEKQKDENGNSIDFKGFNTILRPVIEELQSEGLKIEMKNADKAIKPISNDEMCEYYSNIHVYICVSNKEGTPKPLLEALGCGVPVITTDVGIAKEALGKEQSKFILGERKIGQNDVQIREKLKEFLKYIYYNKNILRILSTENYDSSQRYEITNMKKQYESYYRECMKGYIK